MLLSLVVGGAKGSFLVVAMPCIVPHHVVLLDLDKHFIWINGVTFGDVNFTDGSPDRSLNLGFHFHGFSDDHWITSIYRIAFFDQNVDNGTGHGGCYIAGITGYWSATALG